MHGWALFFSAFGVIFVAELPDKTALAALALATRYRPAPVFIGAGLALTIQTVVAVAAGRLVALLPSRAVHLFVGGLFLASAAVMWFGKEEAPEDADARADPDGVWRSLWRPFLVVFVAEWGDLTQLATAGLAARYSAPYVIFAGATAALWCVAAVAVFVGNRAAAFLDARLTRRFAGGLFLLVGVALLAGWL